MSKHREVKRQMHLTFSKDLTRSYKREGKKLAAYRYFEKTLRPPNSTNSDRQYYEFRELSDFLERYMPGPYVQATWDLRNIQVPFLSKPHTAATPADRAIECVLHGLNDKTIGKDIPDFEKKWGKLRFVTGSVREHINTVFAPEEFNLNEHDLGLKTLVKDEEGASKLNKRLKRLLAPTEVYFKDGVPHFMSNAGHIKKQTGPDRYLIDSERGLLDVRFQKMPAELEPYVDGMLGTFSVRGAHLCLFIEDPRIGDVVPATALTGWGEYKGFAEVVDQEVDVSLFMPKKELSFIDEGRFYISRLSTLHAERTPKYDMQSIINFFSTPEGIRILEEDFSAFYDQMGVLAEDMEGWHQNFLRIASNAKQPENWPALLAAMHGIYNVFPGLFRAQAAMVEEQVEETLKGRCPMTGVVRRYLAAPPDMFEPDGTPNPKRSRLSGNCVFSPGVPEGPVYLYRQPNGNPSEKFRTHSVGSIIWGQMGRGNVLYMAPDMMLEAKVATPEHPEGLGGYDLDDPAEVVFAPRKVAYLDNLPAYPLRVPELVEQVEKPEINRKYIDRRRERLGMSAASEWNARKLVHEIVKTRSQMTIGRVVNPVMIDTLMSRPESVQSMIEDAEARIVALADNTSPEASEERERLLDAIELLEMRPPYQLADVASDLEGWIDRIKLKGGIDNSANDRFTEFFQNQPAFPKSATISKIEGRGRLPQRIWEEQPVLLRTPLCRFMDGLPEEVEAFRNLLFEIEWQHMMRLPAEVTSLFPADELIVAYVSEMRRSWRQAWELERQSWAEPGPAAIRESRKKLSDELEDFIANGPYDQMREYLWVELGRRIYNDCPDEAMVGEDGKLRHVFDGLMWTPSLAPAGINALKAAGLTGEVQIVEFFDHCQYLTHARGLEVKVEQGVVMQKKDGKPIGTCLKLADGEYNLVGKTITVRPAHEALRGGMPFMV